VSCRVLVDATNIRAGHGLWSWLDAVSDDDTASVKRWHFNSKFNWLALVISRHETGMSLTCTFQAERNSPHEIQPNGEVGYDIKTAAARVSSRLTDFCMKRFSLRYSENKGFTRADIYETFGEFSKMVPVLWIGEKLLGKFNPYCDSCTFIKPDLSVVECCSGTCIKGLAAITPAPQSSPDWQHNLMLPPPIGPHCSDPVARQVIATVKASSAPMHPNSIPAGAKAFMLQSANCVRSAPNHSAPVFIQQQNAVAAHSHSTATGYTIRASRPVIVAAPAMDAAPPPYSVDPHVRHAPAITRAAVALPDAAATVGPPAAAKRQAEDKDGDDRPRKARRITKEDE
jgi:hypothetical protein